MKSLVDVDFALVEKHQIKDTINHYNHMCDNARKVIDNDPFIRDYLPSSSPIKLIYSEHDPDTVLVQWADTSGSNDDGYYLEESSHELNIKILTYSEAEIKSYLGARKKTYELERKEKLEQEKELREEKEFEVYKNLKKKYEHKG